MLLKFLHISEVAKYKNQLQYADHALKPGEVVEKITDNDLHWDLCSDSIDQVLVDFLSTTRN